MATAYRWAADLAVGAHFVYLAYLLVGGFLAWRWPRTVYLHVLAAIWAALIVATRVPCPLTELQNLLREQAGLPAVRGGFIAVYVRGTFYPADHETLTQALVALLVVASWVGLYLRHRHGRRSGYAAVRS